MIQSHMSKRKLRERLSHRMTVVRVLGIKFLLQCLWKMIKCSLRIDKKQDDKDETQYPAS